MLNILITGANGQLGNELRQCCNESANNYLFTDIAELDITNAEAVQQYTRENKINVIVNCAAYTQVDRAEEEEALADRINHRAVANLAMAATQNKATLIHISTDYVFAGTAHIPYTEEDITQPATVYGRTKLAGEEAVRQSGCNYLIIRTAWLYSTFGSNFVKTMLRLTAEREVLQVVADQTGCPTYAADLAAAIHHIIEQKEYRNHQGTYHFTNEGVCTWYDFASEIARQAGHTHCRITPCTTDEYPTKAHRPAYSVLDTAKIKKTFGIQIPAWQESLTKCLKKLEK